ncbi:MAG: C4-type zinc ribbon domain-containing protein [Candidatus Omnitrophica bacterium]|nr:C4-type zinc ribbon domain-containing protein [Candidatus Omnitrophota bacterium]
MPEVSIREQIKKLLELQNVDSEIYRLNREKEDKPALLKQMEAAFEEKKALLQRLEDERKALLLKRKEKEGQLAQKEEQAKKLEGQLFQIKTNKEYTAMRKEIAGIKADNSLIEDEIISLFEQADNKDKEIDAEKKRLQEEEARFNSEKKAVDERVKEIDALINTLKEKRGQMAPLIEKSVLAQYERILKNRDGSAIVAVKDNCCGGCFINLRPQVINEIKMNERLVFCGSCSRILCIDNE